MSRYNFVSKKIESEIPKLKLTTTQQLKKTKQMNFIITWNTLKNTAMNGKTQVYNLNMILNCLNCLSLKKINKNNFNAKRYKKRIIRR